MATRYKDRITILEDAEIEELYGRGPSIIPVEEKSFMGKWKVNRASRVFH